MNINIRTMEDATANKNITVAAIDLGSNTFRLLVAEIKGNETTVLLKRNVTVKLGHGLSAASGLAPATIANGLAALAEFKAVMDRANVDCCRCCGTEALRKAVNAKVFLDSASEVVGVEIKVISGREEAILSCRGVLAAMADPTTSFPLLIIDVGGSSTELIYLKGPSAQPLSVSLPAGAAVFTELAATGGRQAAVAGFSAKLRAFLKKTSVTTGKITVVGTGGTATALAVLDLALDHYDEKKVHGHQLMGEGIMQISSDLTTMSAAARDFLPGLEEGRGNILMAGLEIYQEILATIEVDSMIISDSGLLEGIMLSCLEQGAASST
jgi:exopolyphosphatase/guanosine-5'-triphosphate,3'-diphosphate pyrophosphatase